MRTVTVVVFVLLLGGLGPQRDAGAQVFTRAQGRTALVPLESFEPRLADQLFEDAGGDQYHAVSRYLSCRPSPDDEWRVAAYESDARYVDWVAGPVDDGALFGVPKRFDGRWNLAVYHVDCSADYESLAELPFGVAPLGVYPLEDPDGWNGELPAALALGSAFVLDGAWCVGAVPIWCLDAERGVLEVVREPGELHEVIPGAVAHMTALFADFGLDLADAQRPPESALTKLTTLPDGSVVGLAVYRQDYFHCPGDDCIDVGLETTWVLRLGDEAAFEVLFGPLVRYENHFSAAQPVPDTTPPPVLQGASGIHYDPVWDALWVGPVTGWSYSTFPAGEYECERLVPSDHGRIGVGYRIVRLDGGGSGYLDLSELVATTQVPQEGPIVIGPPRCTYCHFELAGIEGGHIGLSRADAGGDLVLRVEYANPTGENGPWLYRLEVDRGGVDLDADQLTAAEEDALGTSDFDADSDDDGVDDGLEALQGSDPLSAAPPYREYPVALVPSLLLFTLDSALGDGLIDRNRRVFAAAQSSVMRAGTPHCLYVEGGAACVSPDGRELARWGSTARADLGPPAFVSADGRVAAAPETDGVYRVEFETGALAMWLPQEGLAELWPRPAQMRDDPVTSASLYLFPLGADDLLLYPRWSIPNDAAEANYWVVHVDGGGRTSVVLDVAQALLDDGIAPGRGNEPTVPENLCTKALEIRPWVNAGVGYHAETGRVLLGLRGNWDSALLGVHPTEPPVVLQGARGALGREVDDFSTWPRPSDYRVFPFFFSPMADGGYFTGTEVVGPHFERVPRNPWTYPMLTHAFFGSHGQHDTAITETWTSCGHAQLDHLGTEWIPYERRLSPGDTLLMGRGSNPNRDGTNGVMLWAIGPRGGANPLWERGNRDLVAPTGMDLSDDGTLCVADRGGQQLFELAPAGDGSGIPLQVVRHDTGADYIDCHYDGDHLALLLGGPDRVEEIDLATGSQTLVETLTPEDPSFIAADLLDVEDGYSVLWLEPGEGGLRGGLLLSDGRFFNSYNGDLVDELDRPILLEGSGLVRAVERPDGNLIAVFSTVAGLGVEHARSGGTPIPEALLVDLDGGVFPATVMAGFFEGTAASGQPPWLLAQVPGGASVDPWTGESDRRCWEIEPFVPGGQGDAGGVDTGLDDGVDAGGASGDGGDDGCGCHTSGGPGASWLAVLASLAAASLRRRRRAASCSSRGA